MFPPRELFREALIRVIRPEPVPGRKREGTAMSAAWLAALRAAMICVQERVLRAPRFVGLASRPNKRMHATADTQLVICLQRRGAARDARR
jgi:hypothetical protein